MNKRKNVRLIGFVGALGVSAALIAAASSGTGAYFTDSASGTLQASSGSLALSTGPMGINFTGLNPGVDKSQTVDFGVKSGSTTNADIWLVFDSATAGYGSFTGANGGTYGGVTTKGGLGQYGHFKLTAPAGSFESYNLQLPSAGDATSPTGYDSAGTNKCTVNKFGLGGSSAQHTIGAGNDLAECGVPAAILLQSDVAPGAAESSATLTFGLTGKAEAQNVPWASVGYKIVATQPGVSPIATW